MNFCCLRLYPAYSISFNSSNIEKFFGVEFERPLSKFRKRKGKLLSCVPIPDKLWNGAFSRHSCAVTAKKCTKKHDAHSKLLFCQSQPISFLQFLLTLPSLLLKLPSNEKFTVRYRLMNERKIIMSLWTIKMKLQKVLTQLQYNVHCNSV